MADRHRPAFGPQVDRVHAKGKRPDIDAHIVAASVVAVDEADFRIGAFQIFIAGPRAQKITLGAEEAVALRTFVEQRELFGIAHGTYHDSPWTDKPSAAFAAQFILEELALCRTAGLRGLVIHLGKTPPETVVRVLPSLMLARTAGPRPRLYLETPAVLPQNSHYESPEKLGAFFRTIRELDPALDSFGLCVDTAHLWSCGADLSARADAEDWLERFARECAGVPLVFHLNDSTEPCGNGVDEHAAFLEGAMWGDYRQRPAASGLAAFVAYALLHDVPAILERKPPEMLINDYDVLLQLAPELRA